MTPEINSLLITLLSIGVTATIAYAVRQNSKMDRMKEKHDEQIDVLQSQVSTLTAQIGRLDVQVAPFWAKVQAQISSDLHHPNAKYKEMDALLQKLDADELSGDERERLEVMAEQRALDMSPDITQSERESASILVMVMRKVLVEQKEIADGATTAVEGVAVVQKPAHQDREPSEKSGE